MFPFIFHGCLVRLVEVVEKLSSLRADVRVIEARFKADGLFNHRTKKTREP